MGAAPFFNCLFKHFLSGCYSIWDCFPLQVKSCYVVQAGVLVSSNPPASAHGIARVIGTCNHAWLFGLVCLPSSQVTPTVMVSDKCWGINPSFGFLLYLLSESSQTEFSLYPDTAILANLMSCHADTLANLVSWHCHTDTLSTQIPRKPTTSFKRFH